MKIVSNIGDFIIINGHVKGKMGYDRRQQTKINKLNHENRI